MSIGSQRFEMVQVCFCDSLARWLCCTMNVELVTEGLN